MRHLFSMLRVLIVVLAFSATAIAAEPHIIPQPSYIEMHQGEFIVTNKTKIVVYDEAWDAAEVFAKDMQVFFGSKRPMHCVKRGNGIKVRADGSGRR